MGTVHRFVPCAGGWLHCLDGSGTTSDCDVFLAGGAQLVAQFLRAQAIDEVILFIVPTVLGAGVRLFDEQRTGERSRAQVRRFAETPR